MNLIGEHTDYNGGWVLPFALPLGTLLLARRNRGNVLRVRSLTLGAEGVVSLSHPKRSPSEPWLDYAAGVVSECREIGWALPGMDCLVASNLPMGAGLSSSASFEMAFLRLFEEASDNCLDDGSAALLGQRVENLFLGLASGVMDQFAVRAGRAGHAVLLRCDTLDYRRVPVQLAGAAFVVADTASARRLTGSEYNTRVRECADALACLRKAGGDEGGGQLATLSDCPEVLLEAGESTMPDVLFRRARHVITENRRVHAACAAMEKGDSRCLGEILDASHQSLRDDYEVSSPALDAMVEALRTQPGCLGARLTGAGFGGCCVALFEEPGIDDALANAIECYRGATGFPGTAFPVEPAAGVDVVAIA
ncbi:MAG: galactokinase [Candidatus Hydrogenedentota bacterium]